MLGQLKLFPPFDLTAYLPNKPLQTWFLSIKILANKVVHWKEQNLRLKKIIWIVKIGQVILVKIAIYGKIMPFWTWRHFLEHQNISLKLFLMERAQNSELDNGMICHLLIMKTEDIRDWKYKKTSKNDESAKISDILAFSIPYISSFHCHKMTYHTIF